MSNQTPVTIDLTFQAHGEVQQTIELNPGVDPKEVLEGMRSGSVLTSLAHQNGIGGDVVEVDGTEVRKLGTVIAQATGDIEYLDVDLVDGEDADGDQDPEDIE